MGSYWIWETARKQRKVLWNKNRYSETSRTIWFLREKLFRKSFIPGDQLHFLVSCIQYPLFTLFPGNRKLVKCVFNRLHLPRLVSCTAIFTYSLVLFLLRNYKEKSFGSRLSWDSNLVLVLCHHQTCLHLHSSCSFSLSRYARHRSREDLRGRNDCLFPAVNIKTSCCSNRSLKRLSSYVQLLLQIMNNNKYFLIPKCDNYKYGMRSDSF